MKVQLHLVPQGWSLLVEGVFYLLAPLAVLLAARGYGAVLWVVSALSCSLALVSAFVRGDLEWLRSPASSLWVFLLGMLIYFPARTRAARRTDNSRPSAVVALVPLTAVIAMGLGWTALPMAVIPFATPILVVIWLAVGQWASRVSGRVDRALGDIAYGVFVGHFLTWMAMLWVAEIVYRTTGVFGIFGTPDEELMHGSAVVGSVFGGALIYWSVERPFGHLRTLVRRRHFG